MTPLSVADGARMLGIHPKTLHHWLTQAHVPVTAHPTDARIKCMTLEQVQQVARLHGRPLLPSVSQSVPLPAGAPLLASSEGQASPTQVSLTAQSLASSPLPADCPHAAALLQKLSCLETKVVTLQEQLAHLALALLHEREQAVEQRLATLESLIHSLPGKPLPADPQEQGTRPAAACASPKSRQLLPAEQRARERMPALIEYGAQGTYVIISSQEGELHLVPDSTEWFEWLATISSFRFVGQQGRFTAHRHGRLSRSWRARRVIHQRHYWQTLGVTDHLTIHRLEQVAAALQSDMASL